MTEIEIEVARCIVRSQNKLKILLVRRAAHNKTNPGKWECPGGKRIEGTSLHETLDIEIPEETGLTRVIFWREEKFVEVDRYTVSEGQLAGTTFVTKFIVGVEDGCQPVILDADHDASSWPDIDDVFAYDLTPQTRKGILAFSELLKLKALEE